MFSLVWDMKKESSAKNNRLCMEMLKRFVWKAMPLCCHYLPSTDLGKREKLLHLNFLSFTELFISLKAPAFQSLTHFPPQRNI